MDLWDRFVDVCLDAVGWVLAGLLVLALGTIVVGGIVWGLTALDRAECRQAAARLGVERRYDFPSGCYYRIDNRWVPADTYRVPEPVQR